MEGAPPLSDRHPSVVSGLKLEPREPVEEGRLATVWFPYEREQGQLDDALARLAADGRELAAVLVTHHHHDHTGYVEALARKHDVPIVAHGETAARVKFEVDTVWEGGETLDLGAARDGNMAS